MSPLKSGVSLPDRVAALGSVQRDRPDPVLDGFVDRDDGPRYRVRRAAGHEDGYADSILADCRLEVTLDGTVSWSWKSYDHLDLDRYLKIDPTPNWTHVNSLQSLLENRWHDAGDERFRPGNILLSPRTLGFIFIVDRPPARLRCISTLLDPRFSPAD